MNIIKIIGSNNFATYATECPSKWKQKQYSRAIPNEVTCGTKCALCFITIIIILHRYISTS